MQLVERKCGQRRRSLCTGWRVLMNCSAVDNSVASLDDDLPSVTIRCCSRHLLVPARDVRIGCEDRHATAGVAHQILNLPLLCRHDDYSAAVDCISNCCNESLCPLFFAVSRRHIGERRVEHDCNV
jgi:hypothetical protein